MERVSYVLFTFKLNGMNFLNYKVAKLVKA